MNKEIYVSIIIATFILLLGIGLGFTNFNINLRVMHTIIGSSFIIIVLLGLKIHYSRLINKSPYDKIAWIHFVTFSALLYLSIKAIRKWNSDVEDKESKDDFIVTYNGKTYNIKGFISKHPGGSVIKNAKNQDLNEIWKEYNVEWHKRNKNVQNILKKYEIKN